MNVLSQIAKNAYESGATFSTPVRAKKWDVVCVGDGYAVLTDYVQDYTVNTNGLTIGVEPHGH